MPRDLKRMPAPPFAPIVESARRVVRQDLQRAGVVPQQVLAGAIPANPEVLDRDGNMVERHNFMLGVDALGDPAARLRVNGRRRKYFRG